MPKVKLPRKSTLIDMTAMCDVAFLLLTFFMLTTKFKGDDTLVVDTPSSISEIKLPDTDILTITIDDKNRVYFGIDGQPTRLRMLDMILAQFTEKYPEQAAAFNFSEEEKYRFSLIGSFGVPIVKLKDFVNLTGNERAFEENKIGIPVDTTNNELGYWIVAGRRANPKLRIAIKADGLVSYPVIKKVMDTLQQRNVNKFNLITDLEAVPTDIKK